jgi:hypothetical protein
MQKRTSTADLGLPSFGVEEIPFFVVRQVCRKCPGSGHRRQIEARWPGNVAPNK